MCIRDRYQADSDVEEGGIVVNKIAELRREKRYALSLIHI